MLVGCIDVLVFVLVCVVIGLVCVMCLLVGCFSFEMFFFL